MDITAERGGRSVCSRRCIAASVFLLVSVASGRGVAQQEVETPAEDKETASGDSQVQEAIGHFRRGIELFEEGNPEAALFEFQRAYQLAPNYRLFYNMAVAHLELHDYAGAVREFEQYMMEGGEDIPADRRVQVKAELERLRDRVGRLKITADVPGAAILLDGDRVGSAPLEGPVLVNIGRRRVEARAPGHEVVSRTVAVLGGDEHEVTFTLPPLAVAVVPGIQTPALSSSGDVQPAEPSMTPFYASAIATGVFAVGAGATAVLALMAKSDLDSALDTVPASPSDVEDHRDRADLFALLSTVLTGATVLGAGLSTYFYLNARRTKGESRTTSTLEVGLGPAAIMARTRF